MGPTRNQPFIYVLLLSLLGLVPACKRSDAVEPAPELPAKLSVFVDTETTVTQSGQDPGLLLKI